jgi:hypothetical protein
MDLRGWALSGQIGREMGGNELISVSQGGQALHLSLKMPGKSQKAHYIPNSIDESRPCF